MPSLTRITPEELHERRWELLALTSVGAFMGPLDGSIVAVALPVMSPELHLSFSASMWVQAAYLLASATLLIPLGRLADHRGRVHFYLAGLIVFTLGSLLAALSMNGTWLIGQPRAVRLQGGEQRAQREHDEAGQVEVDAPAVVGQPPEGINKVALAGGWAACGPARAEAQVQLRAHHPQSNRDDGTVDGPMKRPASG